MRLMICLFLLLSAWIPGIAKLHARSGFEIANELRINPQDRLKRQWEYVYRRKRLMERYGINTLEKEEQDLLRTYLLEHAADAKRANIAGTF